MLKVYSVLKDFSIEGFNGILAGTTVEMEESLAAALVADGVLSENEADKASSTDTDPAADSDTEATPPTPPATDVPPASDTTAAPPADASTDTNAPSAS